MAIKDLIVKIISDSGEFTKETNKATISVDKLENKVDDLGNEVEKTDKKTGGLTETLKKGFLMAVTAAAAALGAMLIQAGNLAKELSQLSYKLGINVQDLDDLKYAVSKTGIEFNDFTEALKDLEIRQGEAAQGNEGVMKTFDDLRVSIYRSDGQLKDTETLFYDVARAISNIEDPSLRAAYANQLMADNGYKILPILEDIQGFIADTDYAKIHDLGINQKEIDDLERYNELMGELSHKIDNLKVDIVTDWLAPKDLMGGLRLELKELDNIKERTWEQDQLRSRILYELEYGTYQSRKELEIEINNTKKENITTEDSIYFQQLRKMGATDEYIASLKEQLVVEREITAEGDKQLSTMRERAAELRKEIKAEKERVSGRGAGSELSGTRLKYKAGQSYERKSGAFTVSGPGQKSGV